MVSFTSSKDAPMRVENSRSSICSKQSLAAFCSHLASSIDKFISRFSSPVYSWNKPNSLCRRALPSSRDVPRRWSRSSKWNPCNASFRAWLSAAVSSCETITTIWLEVLRTICIRSHFCNHPPSHNATPSQPHFHPLSSSRRDDGSLVVQDADWILSDNPSCRDKTCSSCYQEQKTWNQNECYRIMWADSI